MKDVYQIKYTFVKHMNYSSISQQQCKQKVIAVAICSPSLQHGAYVIKASDHVRLLGVIIAADLISMGMSLVFARHASSSFTS